METSPLALFAYSCAPGNLDTYFGGIERRFGRPVARSTGDFSTAYIVVPVLPMPHRHAPGSII